MNFKIEKKIFFNTLVPFIIAATGFSIYGFLLPYMISAKNTYMNIGGFVIGVVTTYVIVRFCVLFCFKVKNDQKSNSEMTVDDFKNDQHRTSISIIRKMKPKQKFLDEMEQDSFLNINSPTIIKYRLDNMMIGFEIDSIWHWNMLSLENLTTEDIIDMISKCDHIAAKI